MTYADDLVEQATYLIRRNKSRPKQAALRRAISASYYAIFHELTVAAASRTAATRSSAKFTGAVARTFDHRTMRLACLEVGKRTLSPKVRVVFDAVTIPPELLGVAKVFDDLQTARHAADYDLNRRFLKKDALELVELAADALQKVRALSGEPVFDRFLFLLQNADRLRG